MLRHLPVEDRGRPAFPGLPRMKEVGRGLADASRPARPGPSSEGLLDTRLPVKSQEVEGNCVRKFLIARAALADCCSMQGHGRRLVRGYGWRIVALGWS